MTKYKKFKRRVFELLEVAAPHDIASKAVDIVLVSLIMVNVIIIIADTFRFKGFRSD